MMKGKTEQRLDQLERFHRETSERITSIEIKLEEHAKSISSRISDEASERSAHDETLRKSFLEFAANNIGWGYAGLVFIILGTIMGTFSDRSLGFTCPLLH
jgi:hypothetical protein